MARCRAPATEGISKSRTIYHSRTCLMIYSRSPTVRIPSTIYRRIGRLIDPVGCAVEKGDCGDDIGWLK